MTRDPLAAVILAAPTPPRGRYVAATLTDWDPATYANTVTDGAAVYTNLPVLNPGLLVPGRVLLGVADAGLVILGNTYVFIPPAPPEA